MAHGPVARIRHSDWAAAGPATTVRAARMTESQSPAPTETPSAVSKPSFRSRVRELAVSHADRLLAVLGALVFALSYGFDYGSDNQLIYLLKSLCIATPGILERDWYAAEVTHYHPVFAYLGAALIGLNRDGWAVALAQIALITTGMSYVYELLRALSTKRVALAAFFCTVSIALVTRTSGVAVSYVFDSLLQPSALGSLGLLAALGEFVRGRYLASGIWIGLAGLFHANYLVLAIPTFGLMQLLLGFRGLFPRLLRQLGPLMIAAIPVLPVMLSTASSPDAERARDLVFDPLPSPLLAGFFLQGAGPIRRLADVGCGARRGAVPRPEHGRAPARHRPGFFDGAGLGGLGVLDRGLRSARGAAVRLALCPVRRSVVRSRGLPRARAGRQRTGLRATAVAADAGTGAGRPGGGRHLSDGTQEPVLGGVELRAGCVHCLGPVGARAFRAAGPAFQRVGCSGARTARRSCCCSRSPSSAGTCRSSSKSCRSARSCSATAAPSRTTFTPGCGRRRHARRCF